MKIHPYAEIFPAMTGQEFAALKEDIRTNGLREPLLVHHGMLVDGRNRLRACEELGIEPATREWDGDGDSLIPVVVSLNLHRRHLTPSQRNAIGADVEELFAKEAKKRQVRRPKSVPMNSSGQGGEARQQAAIAVGGSASEISKAKAVKEADPKLHEEVKAGKVTLNRATGQVRRIRKKKEMEIKAKEVEAVFGAGPARDLGWEIITGDCLEVMESMEMAPCRLVFADPPYNIGIEYGEHHDDSMPTGEYLEWCGAWIGACARLLTPDASFFLLVNLEHGWQIVPQAVQAGLHLRQWLTWYETFGVNCTGKYNRCSRALLWFVNDPRRFVWNPEEVNRQSDRQVKYKDKRADPAGKVWDDVWGINPSIPRLTDTCNERIPGFPTQLPLALLRPIIRAHSDRGDLVLDPFNGSGTTGAACIELSRRYVGIEASEEFAAAARDRLMIGTGEVAHAV